MFGTVATNSNTHNQRVRIFIYPDELAAMLLDTVELALERYNVIDRGHRHSDGHSIVEFILTPKTAIPVDTVRG